MLSKALGTNKNDVNVYKFTCNTVKRGIGQNTKKLYLNFNL